MPKAVKDLTGQRYGRLTVLAEVLPRTRPRFWSCLCDCGNEHKVSASNLLNGHTKSCGCYYRERRKTVNVTHGAVGTKEYATWKGMKERCLSPKNKRYQRYGGRGISVCRRWSESFEAFLEDMGYAPTSTHTIDRKDNNGDYEPSNCRWATPKEQANNRTSNIQVVYEGVRYPSLKLLAFALGLSYDSLRRNRQKTETIEQAVERSTKA